MTIPETSHEVVQSILIYNQSELMQLLNVDPVRMHKLGQLDRILTSGTKFELETLSHELYGDKDALTKTIKLQVSKGLWWGAPINIKL